MELKHVHLFYTVHFLHSFPSHAHGWLRTTGTFLIHYILLLASFMVPAHAGHAFVAELGHVFGDTVLSKLSHQCTLRGHC
eukprot:m.627845 g.627845  ORF g.627845 m.627845 type:complete len:80 (+) comp22562_c0_seq7:5353-5592(+)